MFGQLPNQSMGSGQGYYLTHQLVGGILEGMTAKIYLKNRDQNVKESINIGT
jgi:hypothetical protein